jgi:hypothetical protein
MYYALEDKRTYSGMVSKYGIYIQVLSRLEELNAPRESKGWPLQ